LKKCFPFPGTPLETPIPPSARSSFSLETLFEELSPVPVSDPNCLFSNVLSITPVSLTSPHPLHTTVPLM